MISDPQAGRRREPTCGPLLRWGALLEGGQAEACGWLRDQYGVCWQIVPAALDEMMNDRDTARSKRVTDAMLTMVKLDIAKLRAADNGDG
jgi:predicted 3-demethylubiquinone-9 3-methyltransferase (glyoxalase superfamily)